MDFPGIIGTGTRALDWYYNTIQQLGRDQWGDDFVVPVKILGTPFHFINEQLPHNMRTAGEIIVPYFAEMEKMTRGAYILANITMHQAVDIAVQNHNANRQFIHLSRIIEASRLKDEATIMILGSAFTMQNDYLLDLFRMRFPNLKIIQPNEDAIRSFDALRKAFYTQSDELLAQKTFRQLAAKYTEVSTFVIACTEHALAFECCSSTLRTSSKFLNLPLEQCKALLKTASKQYV